MSKALEDLVLGAILLDGNAYWEVESMLSAEAFQDGANRQIFGVIRDLAIEGRAFTREMVVSRLTNDGFDVEPGAYVSAVIYQAGKEDQLPLVDYADTLRDGAIRRRIGILCDEVAKSVKRAELAPSMILDRISERVSEMSHYADVENESTLKDSIVSIAKRSRSDGESSSMGLQPCLHGLTQLIGHVPPGSLILMAGGPGSGKTAMLFQQMLFSSTQLSSTLFELEMENRALVSRSLFEYTNISAEKIMTGISPEEEHHLYEVAQQFNTHNLRVVSPPKMSIQQLRSRAIAHKHKYGLSLIGVDHLKLIQRFSKYRDDPVQRAYQNANDLKILAKELNCVVIALCQLTKAGRDKDHPEPEMEDIYGGALEEHADVILALLNRHEWLKRNPPKTNKGAVKEKWDEEMRMSLNRIEVYKLKHRFRAPRGRLFVRWDGDKTRFQDIESFPVGDLLEQADSQLPMAG